MKRQHILKQMGVMVLSAVLSLTPAMQVAAAVPEDGTQILETEDSAEADTASATQEESAGEETQPAETEVTPTKEVTATPEPETEESTAETTEESTAETTTETTEETTEESTEQKTEKNTAETTEESTTETMGEEDTEDAAGAGNANALPQSDTEGQDADTADDQSGYDINKPVLENAWLPQSGQTLTREDTLEIRVQAYDADSGIASVTAGLAFGTGDTNSWSDSVYLEFDEEQQNYVGWYPLTDILATDGCVSSVTVTDQAGNYVSEYSWEGSMLDKEDCRFQIQQDEILIDSKAVTLNFKNQGATVNVGEYLEASLQLSPPLDESLPYNLYISWENPETQNSISWPLSSTSEGEGIYEGIYGTDNYMSNGKWVLTEIYADIQGEQYPINTDALGDLSGYWFELQGSTEVPQPESPIEEVFLEPCGEMLRPGDTVSLKVKAAGDDQKWGTDAWADFYPAVDIDWNRHFSVDLTYNPDTQMFEGSYTVTEETYPTEWYLESIYLTDAATYNGYYYRTDEILDAEYYFLVENDGTFTNPSFDVEVQFYAIDEGGYYNELTSFNAEDVVRRTTYAEAGITTPEAPDYIPEGLTFVGWVDESVNPFDSEKQLLNGSYVRFYAQYDQRFFNVSYEYYDKDLGIQYDRMSILSPQEITYGELRTLIQENLPDVSDRVPEEMGFEGWNISFDYPDEDQVAPGQAAFSVSAAYRQSVVNLTYEFLNTGGTGMTQTHDELFVENGITVGEFKEMIARQPYPEEGYQDLGFVSWEISGGWNDEDVLGGTNWITVQATYEKKVVAANFSYLDRDGIYSTGLRKVFLFDEDSTYADLLEEISAVAAPEDVSPELAFEGWKLELYESEDTPLKAVETVYPTAEFENAMLKISYQYVGADGVFTGDYVEKLVPSGSTIGEIRTQLTDYKAPEPYGNLKFEKWELPSWLTDDTELTGVYSLNIEADYGDPVAEVFYQYIRENTGVIQERWELLQIKEGSTYQELMEAVADQAPTDVYEAENVQWSSEAGYDPESTVSNMSYVSVKGTYEDRRNVFVGMSYVTESGALETSQHIWLVEEGSTYESLRETLAEQPLPEQFEGLKFQGWSIYGMESGVISESNPSMSMIAQYDKCVIRYIVDSRIGDYENVWDLPSDMDWDVEEIVLIDNGGQLQLPDELGGYRNITWLNDIPGDSVEVTTHLTFYGYGVKDDSEPEEPTDPEKPEEPADPETPVKPENPTDPGTPEEPTVPETPVVPETPEDTSRLPEELENVVVQEITAAQPGQTVTVDMQSATVVTREMLGAAKGKDVNIQLNLGGYSWTINGMDIMASDLSDIDLEVKQNTGAIPSRVIQSLAGDNPVQQLSLTHNGDFGFRASLTINVGSENSGKYGNLYYYDSTGKMVFMNAGVIDANGNVTLSFSHASEYLIVVNDRVMSNDDVPADLRPGANTSGGSVTTPVSTGNTSANNTSVTRTDKDVVNTADATPTAWAGVFLLAALVLAGAGAYQKRRKA